MPIDYDRATLFNCIDLVVPADEADQFRKRLTELCDWIDAQNKAHAEPVGGH